MKLVQILENIDMIDAEDWCRPLSIVSMSGGMSDSYSFKSMYSGTPENNVKWCKVKSVIGKPWFGETVKSYNKSCGLHEFIRGDIPKSNQLNMTDYNDLSKTK